MLVENAVTDLHDYFDVTAQYRHRFMLNKE